MLLMEDHSRKMTKAGKEGFIHNGYSLAPRHRDQKMVDIINRNHTRVTLKAKGFRNKYSCTVWHNTGNTGAGCRTSHRRFNY